MKLSYVLSVTHILHVGKCYWMGGSIRSYFDIVQWKIPNNWLKQDRRLFLYNIKEVWR